MIHAGAGASLGPEGPLVHLGAMAGSFLTGGVRLRQTMPSFFRNEPRGNLRRLDGTD